jgi:hypothetical protein
MCISGSIFFFNFYCFQKIQKQKKIFAETNRGTKIFKSNTGQNRDTFWAKRDTICLTSEALQKIF